MTTPAFRSGQGLRVLAAVAALFVGTLQSEARQQTPRRPASARDNSDRASARLADAAQAQRRPAPPRRPAPSQPAAPPPATEKPPAPAPAPPAPPPPQDLRFKTAYTTGDQRTETVTLIKGERERFEFQDMVLLRQHDQKRVVQISRTANTYLIAPEDAPSNPATVGAPDPTAAQKPAGVVMMTVTIVDTGERKMAFGQQARHVKTTIDKQPGAGACDASKQRIETDGWYVDPPKAVQSQTVLPTSPAPIGGGCNDRVEAMNNGDPKTLGFPIAYTTTIVGEDGKPAVVSMEVSELEVTTLDAALFEIPQGLNAASNIADLGKALSDASEAKLVAETQAPPPTPPARRPGVVRIGVPELTNKTTTAVDTRALRGQLIGHLSEAKFEAIPLPATAPGDLQKRATELALDYVATAEVTELKVAKSGGFGGILKAASQVTAGGAGPQKDPTEASVAIKLLSPDGKARVSSTVKGKDGGGMAKTGLGIAKFAAMGMMMGPMMMSGMYNFNPMAGANMGGFGMLGNPALFNMQAMGMGMGPGMAPGRAMGIDQTAGAASFLMQQAMTMNSAAAGGGAGGPSFADSLDAALESAAKAVAEAVKKAEPKGK